jgi:hypothetical protein
MHVIETGATVVKKLRFHPGKAAFIDAHTTEAAEKTQSM